MNINELHSFDLAAAVKFHDRLNPRIWGRDEHLLPEVKQHLLAIAADFQEFLGIPDLAVKDITVSGSNAAYSYTPDSDIDLHLVVDMPEQNSEVYQELFNAKKYQYNDEHDIRIGGADVELYVQPSDQPHHSLGIYSVRDGEWKQVPRRKKADIDDQCVLHKSEDIAARIESAIDSGNKSTMQKLWDKIKTMRSTGLAQSGEFGCDNLVFKLLRRSGHIERLKKAKTAAHDLELSLQERKRKKRRVNYGFGGWWYPGFGYAGDSGEGGGDGGGGESVREGHYGSSLSSEDGVAPSTAMFVTEDDRESIIQQFIKHTAQRLGIETLPQIELHNDDEWSKSAHSFGRYEPEAHVLHVNLQGRHIMDILRTTAHELAHCRQHEIKGIEVNDGATGSPVENEAHAVAGIIMRDFADSHPELFDQKILDEGRISRTIAAGVIALAAGLAQAQEYQQQTSPTLSALNTALRLYGLSRLTAAGVKDELNQEVKNYIRAQGGDANAQNQSWAWKQQQQQQQQQQQPVKENASGYIPKNKKEAAMPQYAMALSVDIHPGEVGRQANKLALKTGRNGEPQLLMKTANLREGRIRDLNEPLGPETPPTMPAGTVRVDVSDVYDWYKLGQHISNMKGLGRHDFGAGPPSSIISFGDEETEHKFIKDLAATGLDVTDIDPRDPKQPPGMRRIKTDPTYNVSEAGRIQYKEIEFVCANPQFPDATDPELQQQMYVGLTKIPGVIPLWQDQSDYSAGQASLTAIYKDRASRQQIMKLAKQLGVKIDLEQPVSDSYVDRAIRGEHEGQRGMTEADDARTAKSAIDQTEVFGVRGYRARCLEPGCEWHSRSYDRIKQAQDSAKKHAAAHIKQGVAEGLLNESAIFLNPNSVIIGQDHGQPLNLSPEVMKRVKAIAAKHGAWYEGNGADRVHTKGQIDNYVGSFDDEVAKSASPNDPKWIYVLFANVDANNRVQRVGVDPRDTIFNRLMATDKDNSFQGIGFTAQALQKFLAMSSEGKYDFVKMSQQPATQENLTRFLKAGEALMWPSNWEQYPNKAGKIAKAATVDARDQYLATRKAGVYVVGSGHLKAVQQITGKQGVAEGVTESRGSLFSWLKQQFPTWPDYVVKDFLYQQAKTITSQEQLADFLEIQKKDFGKVKWRLENLPITLDIFTPKTQRMIKSREGGSSNPFQVPKDAERHAQQLKMIQQQGVRTEPIIVAKLNNGYDLIEGWHRTIQHLKVFPEGYTGPAYVGYGATYTSESKQDVAEGFDKNTVNDLLQRIRSGKTIVNLSTEDQQTLLSVIEDAKQKLVGMLNSDAKLKADWPQVKQYIDKYQSQILMPNWDAWFKSEVIKQDPKQNKISLDNDRLVVYPAMYNFLQWRFLITFLTNKINRNSFMKSDVDVLLKLKALLGTNQTVSEQGMAEQDELVESLRREFEMLEDEFIGEIKMSPSNLRAEAAKTGALAGMEFEMIVPSVESDDPEMEPDYNSDERCRSIDDAVEFFHDGDYNSRRQVERLRERMQEDFEEWLYEKIDEDWANNPEQHIYQYLINNANEQDIGEILGIDLSDADGVTKDQFSQAAESVNDSELQPYYDSARDWHREEYNDSWDESDWLDEQDLNVMSAIESAYDITWPFWTYNNESAVDIDSVAEDFSEAVGMPVNTSQRYHGATREAGKYVIEPDGSLRGDSEDDMGLEFVSPPMPIDEMLDQLKKVREWAGRNGCYTNRSTGLHINISVPEFSNDKLDYVKLALLLGDQYVLDQFGRSTNTYTKSALGIVQDRVRAMPKTAQAMLDKMRGHMEDLATKAIHTGETDKFTSINTKEGYIEFRSPGGDWLDENFDKVENTLLRFTVALKAAMDPEAYREEYLKKLYKLLEPTAQDSKGSDTVRYFADYVAGKIPAAALRSFVKQAQLQRKIAKAPASGKQYWWRVWKDGQDARNTAMIEVVATTEKEAIDKAAAEFEVTSSAAKAYMDAVALRPYVETETEYEIFQVAGNRVVQTFRAADNDAALAYFDRTVSAGDRPYYDVRRAGSMAATQPAAQQPADGFEFELSQTDIENRLGLPDQTGDANYEVVNRNTQRPVFVFIANTAAEASRKYSDWLAASGLPDDTEDYGFRERARPGSTLDIQRRRADQSAQAAVSPTRQQPATGGNFTGVWLILDPEGDVIHSFAGVGNVQSDANRVAMDWLRRNPGSMQAGVTVVPEML